MTTLVGFGDRLITPGGRESWLKRGSVPFASFGQGAVALAGGGVVSYQQLYEEQPWVGVMVHKLARQVARLPLYAHRLKDGTRWEGESEPLEPGHPLAMLLERPWPRAGEFALKQKACFPALIHGNAVMAVVRDEPAGPPSGLAPLDFRWLVAHCMAGDGIVDVWETSQGGSRRLLAPDDVLHFAWEAGAGDLGVSPLRQLGVTLRTEDSAQRYQSASFENGARPSGALVLPAESRLDEAERQELREEIRAQHAGVDGAFQLALLSGGMDWKPFAHTAVEAELIDQRKLNREEVAAIYDVPPPLVGILDHATYSNVAEMHRMLYGMVLGPWLTLIEETLKAQLIDTFAPWADERLYVAFDLTEVLKGDTLSEIQAVREAIGTGVMTPNEARRRLNLSRYDDDAADELYLPANNLQALGDTPDAADAPGMPAPALPAPFAQLPAGEDPVSSEDAAAVKSHVDRHRQIMASRAGAGAAAFDRARFVRELRDDLDGRHQALVERAADALASEHAESHGP